MAPANPPTEQTVVLVGHDASRTGAPKALLSELRWLVAQRVEVRSVLLRGGPLVDDFAMLAPCVVLDSRWARGTSAAASALSSIGMRAHAPPRVAYPQLRRATPAEVVVANTLASLTTAHVLSKRSGVDSRLVCHVHELDGVASRLLPRSGSDREGLLRSVDRYVAAGSAVRAMLVDRFGVPAEKVSVVEPFVDAAPFAQEQEGERTPPSGPRPIVLSVGSLTRRKGPERFVDLMAVMSPHPRCPVGIWMGGDLSGVVAGETRADIRRGGLDGSVTLIGDVPDPGPILAGASVLVSTAVEDPYPLAVMEAAALGLPTTGFASGGLRDMLTGAGLDHLLVEVGDVLALADRVTLLLDDEDARREAGERMRSWVMGTHLSEHMAPLWWQAVAG